MSDLESPEVLKLQVHNLNETVKELRVDIKNFTQVLPQLVERLDQLARSVQEDNITLNTTLRIHMDESVSFRDTIRDKQYVLEKEFAGYTQRINGSLQTTKLLISVCFSIATVLSSALYGVGIYLWNQKISLLEKVDQRSQETQTDLRLLKSKMEVGNANSNPS